MGRGLSVDTFNNQFFFSALMVKWLDKLVERLRGEKTVAQPPTEPIPEPEWVVHGYEPIVREGVYRFCYQPDLSRRMSPTISFSTSRYVALLDAAVDGSVAIEVARHFHPDYSGTSNSHVFPRPLSVLTPYDVFNVFWKNLRQPIFPGLRLKDQTRLVFSDDTLPVLYREGGLELLTFEPALKRSAN